jgi:hypothetical protein
MDTDREAERVQLELLRRAGSTRRAAMALRLSAEVLTMARRAVRRAMPGATEQEVALRFVELHYGRQLAEGLRRHFDSQRP